jgi:hypothetical protein
MNRNRKTAILVGVLYIIGTVTGILSVVFTKPLLDDPASLLNVPEQGNQIRLGALLIIMMGLALALIPVMMFPILKKRNEVFALGYVVFRSALETFTYIALGSILLLLVAFSQVSVQAGTPDAPHIQALGTLLRKAVEMSTTTTEIVFPLGALMFYAVLYQANLLPRWLSGWGLLGAILYEAAGLLHLFDLIGQTSAIQPVLFLPLGVQELVLALWLIVKGFNPSAKASDAAKGFNPPAIASRSAEA